ncbi:MAG: hypothetical protein WA152_03375 [Microgenomates group bacterium]
MSVLDGIETKPLSSFDGLKSSNINKVQIEERRSDDKVMSVLNPEIKVVKSEYYEESVNELVKNVVVRAKVEAGRSKNDENIAKYQEIEKYAVNNHIISQDELNVRFEAVVKEDVQAAETVLKEVDSAIEMAVAALKNIENFDPANLTEIYFVAMKLDSILDLKLDSSTRHDVENAIKRIHNVMELIEKNVEYNKSTLEEHTNIENPFSFLTQLFSPKLSISTV